MNDIYFKSILEMNGGAFMERANCAMAQITDNINDPNTPVKFKRKMVMTYEFTVDENRENVVVNCVVKTVLAPLNPSRTFLYATGDGNFVEAPRQTPGQIGFGVMEQEAPAHLKVIKFA